MYSYTGVSLDFNSYLKKTILIIGVLSLFFPNTLLTVFSLVSLFVIIRLTWFKGHLPVVSICLLFQWVQASTKIIQSTIAGKSVNDYTSSFFANLAIFLSLTGILVVAIGYNLVVRKQIEKRTAFTHKKFNDHRAFRLFLFLFAISNGAEFVTSLIPGLSQITVSISHIQWVGYAILFLTCLNNKSNYKYLFIAFGIEMSVNLFGFYSNFREVLLFTAILYLPFIKKLNILSLTIYTASIFIIGYFFIVWTGIKGDFRNQFQDISDLSYTERVTSFIDLYSEFDDSGISTAEDQSLDRLAYTDMLMYCLETVPRVKPYENGTLWFGAIQHILMPRFLFPNKRVLNDSDKANAYTGRIWAGAESGTSISIGYIAESYVDFGYLLMFLPLFILGTIIGAIYNAICRLKVDAVVSFSIAASILFFTKFSLLETSGDKLLGAIVMNFIVIYFFSKFYAVKIEAYISQIK